MEKQTAHSLVAQQNGAVVLQDQPNEQILQFRLLMQNFQSKLNAAPDANGIDKTPDGKAESLVISYVEMTLDELYFGQWETENFKWSVIANEVVGSIDLIVTHPVTNQKLRRVGSASIIIMVDKAPEGVNKNTWALNPDNKKPNAMDLGAGKLKSECLKNAAKSFGVVFGRDLNRKKVDRYKPIIKVDRKQKEADRIKHLIEDAINPEQLELLRKDVPNELIDVWNDKFNSLKNNTDAHITTT